MNPSKEDEFAALSQKHGFKSADPGLHRVFTENIQEEVRNAVRIALLEADNRGQRTLGKHELDVAVRNSKIFPKPQ
jgi:hypothetical protein